MTTPPTESQAHAMGATVTNLPPEVLEAERLAFEAWVKGHCGALEAHWCPILGGYIAPGEDYSNITTGGVLTRGLWAAWRDRAALAYAEVGE